MPGQITTYIAQQTVFISEEVQTFKSINNTDIFPQVFLLANAKSEILKADLVYIQTVMLNSDQMNLPFTTVSSLAQGLCWYTKIKVADWYHKALLGPWRKTPGMLSSTSHQTLEESQELVLLGNTVHTGTEIWHHSTNLINKSQISKYQPTDT